MSKFQIGDRVQVQPNIRHHVTAGWQIGTITQITEGYISKSYSRYKITWDKEQPQNCQGTPNNYLSNNWSIVEDVLELLEVDPRSPVERKIRKLWNASNWVKLDPKRTY